MGLGIQGNGGVVAEVDGTGFRALRVTPRPVEQGSLGYYQLNMTSGTLAAALAASGQVFSMRWSDATRLMVLYYLNLKFQGLTPRTAATLTDFGFEAVVARSFTVSASGGTAATLTGNAFKTRTAQGTTLVADARISSTAALTAGTQTLDGNAFAGSLGVPQRVNPAAATEEVISQSPELLWQPNISNGETPIILAQNEGIVLRNRTVWPAAGTGIVTVTARWAEVAAY
jgi:hypothetical protein